MGDACIQCRRTAEEIIAARTLNVGGVLMTRPRQFLKNSTYQICVDCAQQVKRDHEARDLTLSDSAPAPHGRSMLAGINQPHSPARDYGVAGKLAERGRGSP